MKAHIRQMSRQKYEAIKKEFDAEWERDMEEASRRGQMLWMLAMRQCGLSLRTLDRVARETENNAAIYVKRRKDQCADMWLISELSRHGVEMSLPTREL